ncbi:hypothetical protein [Phytohabitans houttuyneae]|uniref:Uncharacterized protein n=1 Tax=Phytohabitans houttuyneae TaxID=1076126 RepID=A0A6V8K633_9ACTN|nr:hypothetical protein [Phytohabitans houttuyneae]GFJ80662.1 hypothetical protein Phou_048420 [Phytohabitans houttuyneae]
MTRNEMIKLRRQMQRRIRDVVAERRQAANQRSTGASESETSQVKVG